MGDFGNFNTFRGADIRMHREVDIACIKETHNINESEIDTGNYEIFLKIY